MGKSWYAAEKNKNNHLHSKFLATISVLLMSFLLLAGNSVQADGGLIPFYNFSVYEPGQKAIIAWDGETEIMILSVDVYSTSDTKALHMVPFPSLPQVELGDVSSFEKIEELINTHSYRSNNYSYGLGGVDSPSVEIVFHESIGPHNITIVVIHSSQEFNNWVSAFLESEGIEDWIAPENLDEVIEHYLKQDIKYFAFDVIDIKSSEKTVNPLIYTFKSDYLFFPLRISSIIEGDTKITLALIVPKNLPLNIAPMRNLGFYNEIEISLTRNELMEIDPQIEKLIKDDARLLYLSHNFHMKDLNDDIKLDIIDGVQWFHMVDQYTWIVGSYDFDCDGKLELLIKSSDKISVINVEDGSLLWESSINGYYLSPLLEDIDLDGRMEVVVPLTKRIAVLNAEDGSQLWERNYSYSPSYFIIEDINSDGLLEICVSLGGDIYLLEGKEGSNIWAFENNSHSYKICDIVADLDSDSKNEIIVSSKDNLYILNGEDGSLQWTAKIDYYLYTTPILEDLDLDDKTDILIYPEYNPGKMYAFNGENGTIIWKKDIGRGCTYAKPLLADIDQDKKVEIIIYSDFQIHALNGEDGSNLWEFSQTFGYNCRIHIVEDIDLDGRMEILISSYNKTYAINGEVGTQLWEYAIYGYSDTYPIIMEDIVYGIKPEIMIWNSQAVAVLHSHDGSEIWVFKDDDYYPLYLNDVKLGDINFDGRTDILVESSYKIYALHSRNGISFWNFTSGEYIDAFELCDIDCDGIKEILVRAGNKIYAVKYQNTISSGEYHPSKYDNSDKNNTQLIYIIDLVIIITVVTILIGMIYNIKNRRNKSKLR